ncbi:MAG TPA: hypothetical protein DCW46_06985 [Desulfotomaculum sp.]|nr:hypothetical protein [Desulfotomaculum sp.]
MFKKRKTAFCLILALLFILSLAGVSFAQPSDIQNHWAGKQISDWIDKGLAQGYPDGTFKPDNSITRAEFVSLINRSFQLTSSVKTDFSDVSPTNWFAGDIARARAAGYITGFEDGTFRPNKQISRQEAAAILARLLILETSADNSAYLNEFTDAKDISAWSRGSVGAVVAKGLMNGYPDQTIRPAANISRAEAIVTLDRSIAVQVKVFKYDQPGTYGPASGTETIEGNVLISAAGVTLENTKITGSLVLAEGIGDGDVTLKNVIVQGETTVKGGGANSVVFDNCTMPTVIVDKEGVRIVATGNTSVNIVRLESGAALAELKITGPGFEMVSLTQAIPENAKVILDGNFDNVKLEAGKINLSVTGGTVEKLEVAGTAAGGIIDLGSSAKITTLILDAAVSVTGEGVIQTAKVNVSGATIEPTPKVLDKATGVTVTVGAASSTGDGDGSGQGTGGGVAPLNLVGSYLTTTGESIEGSVTVPKDHEIELVFDRGVVRDHWDNNQQCITMRVENGPYVSINVTRAANYLDDTEKRSIYLSPVNSLTSGTTYVITISANLTANNDNTLGTEKEITFTVASGSGGGGGGDGGGDLSDASAALTAAGSKTAGAAFDISITGAKDTAGTDLDGAVAVTITSDKDGEVYNNDTDFTAGAATASILADKVTTAGTNTLTVVIAGVTPQPTVAVTVTALTQIDAANSTVEIAPALAKGVTSDVTITLKDAYGNPIADTDKNIKIVVTITNADPTTAETYTVDGSAVTMTTTLSRPITTDGAGQSIFTVIMPGAIDPSDGVSVQVTQKNGTALGSAFTYIEAADLSNAGATAAAGITAGTAFDISITGAKNIAGVDLEGTVAVTITSDKDGEVYNSDTAFTAGAATASIAADKVITAGTNTLTVVIAGVTPHPTVEVTVTALTQISPANSTVEIAPALAKGVTSDVTITLKDAYGNPIADTDKNIKIVVTVTNADPTTAETYTVDGDAVTSTTTLSRSITTDASGQSIFTVIMPGAIDPSDGVSVQVTQKNGTALGSAFTYIEP